MRDRNLPARRWTRARSAVAVGASIALTLVGSFLWRFVNGLANCSFGRANAQSSTVGAVEWWSLAVALGVVALVPLALALLGASGGFRWFGRSWAVISVGLLVVLAFQSMTDPSSYWATHC